jgi:superfamily II DNA helicase RecQ
MKTLSHSLLKNNIYIYTRESTNFCRVYNKFRQKILRTDVFVIQPIGSVKSLIYQSAPAVFDIVRPVSKGKSISLVISPLTSRMQDLMLRNNLTEKSVRNAFLYAYHLRFNCVPFAFHFYRNASA